jgi:hypothetical protein
MIELTFAIVNVTVGWFVGSAGYRHFGWAGAIVWIRDGIHGGARVG